MVRGVISNGLNKRFMVQWGELKLCGSFPHDICRHLLIDLRCCSIWSFNSYSRQSWVWDIILIWSRGSLWKYFILDFPGKQWVDMHIRGLLVLIMKYAGLGIPNPTTMVLWCYETFFGCIKEMVKSVLSGNPLLYVEQSICMCKGGVVIIK